MRNWLRGSHAITDVFVYCLMGLFALIGIFVALLGARAYKTVAENAQTHTEQRLPGAFIRTFTRAADAADAVAVTEEAGYTVLALTDSYDGFDYVTRVYCRDGYLTTSLTEAGEAFDPLLGEDICALSGFVPSVEGQLLRVDLTYPDGETETVSVYLRAAG